MYKRTDLGSSGGQEGGRKREGGLVTLGDIRGTTICEKNYPGNFSSCLL